MSPNLRGATKVWRVAVASKTCQVDHHIGCCRQFNVGHAHENSASSMTAVRHPVALAIFALLCASAVAAKGPPAVSKAQKAMLQQGERLFVNCASCHTLDADGDHGVGPNLWSTFGAAAASKPDFSYSAALRQSGITWNETTLDRWLADPKALVPDNKMAFVGLKSAVDRQALIAYLRKRTATK